MTFSFDASQINDGGLNQARFELGDCLVVEPEKNAFLSDEEILAVLETNLSWKRKKLRLIDSLLHRFSFEVNQSVREAEWQLSDRFKHFEALRKKLLDEIAAEGICAGFKKSSARPPIFYLGMNDNRR